MYGDLVPLCKDCHTRLHFPILHAPPPYEREAMLKRINYLKRTRYVRNFKLGSLLNAIVSYIISWYRV